MTVALAVRRIAPSLLIEARAACSSLAIPTEDWGGGIPHQSPRVVITQIEVGDRRIPDEVCNLLEATPGVRAVVCAAEPLVKPRIDLVDGRVTLLSPPIDRTRLIAVLRSALDVPAQTTAFDANHRFEALRRTHWVAWARGPDSPHIKVDESNGLTLLVGDGEMRDAVRCITAKLTDDELEVELAGMLGPDQAAIHLSVDTAEWRIYWPRPDAPMWMCSPKRLPAKWQINAKLGTQRFFRISGFPQDQLVFGWASAPSNIIARLDAVLAEGGPATLGVLATFETEHPAFAGGVVEVR